MMISFSRLGLQPLMSECIRLKFHRCDLFGASWRVSQPVVGRQRSLERMALPVIYQPFLCCSAKFEFIFASWFSHQSEQFGSTFVLPWFHAAVAVSHAFATPGCLSQVAECFGHAGDHAQQLTVSQHLQGGREAQAVRIAAIAGGRQQQL